jgi:hypothetical protein
MNKHPTAFLAALLALPAGALQAGPIYVPNASFESPTTTYAWPNVDAWQQVPDPNALQSGVFLNTLPGDPYHIDNCDGNQAAFLFASNQVALFQDHDSTDWSNAVPTHAFNATFDVGNSYTLTVGVIGTTNLSIPMQAGTTFELSLYYRDIMGSRTTVAAKVITNDPAIFTSVNHFMDCQVRLPIVLPTDPWAGQHIGVQFLSTVSPALEGGYWDLDNVRLTSDNTPVLLTPARTNTQFTFTLASVLGLRFEILASTNSTLPLSDWTSLGIVTNATGATPFLDPATNFTRRFYRARQVP